MKTYRLEIVTPAQRELEEIARVHLDLVGPVSARKITDQIYGSLERLKTFPMSGSLPRDRYLREAGYRFLISGKYICMYRLIEDTVFVNHIVHGATDYPRLLKTCGRTGFMEKLIPRGQAFKKPAPSSVITQRKQLRVIYFSAGQG